LYFLLRVVAKLLVLLLSSGIDLESMSIAQRDALLVFRTLCKVGSLSNDSIAVNFYFYFWQSIAVNFLSTLLIIHTLNLTDGYEGRQW